MGIKSGFNSVSQIFVGDTSVREVYYGTNLVFSSDKGKLALWRYSNNEISGKTLLYNYISSSGGSATRFYAYANNVTGTLLPSMDGSVVWTTTTNIQVGTPIYKSPIFASVIASIPSVDPLLPSSSSDTVATVVNSNVFTIGSDNFSYKRFNIFDRTVPYFPDTLYVPMVRGKSVLNSMTNGNNSGYTPFYNRFVKNVNLQNVPFRNNRIDNAFSNCTWLKSAIGINNSVVNMSNTFSNCIEFDYNAQIPDSVENMSATFVNCWNLNQNIRIPSSVTNMYCTFANCRSLDQNIRVPNNVTVMDRTFASCSNFNQRTKIPSNAVDLESTFWKCNTLNRNIDIPSSVMWMRSAFGLCSNFSSWINIYSTNINTYKVEGDNTTYSYAYGAFNTNNDSAIPNVFLVYKYINNVNTPTFNAIKQAGWNVNGGGIVVGTSPNRIRTWDDGANYTDRVYNGSHCIVGKWWGGLDTFLNNNQPWATPEVPEKLFLSNIPVALNYPCFRGNTVVTSVDFGTEIPWATDRMGYTKNSNAIYGAFEGCTALITIKGVVNSHVVNITDVFSDCSNLEETYVVFPQNGIASLGDRQLVNCRGVYYNSPNIKFSAPLSRYVSNLYDYFGMPSKKTGKLGGSFVIPPAASNISRFYHNRQENVGNTYILSDQISNITNYWGGYPTTFDKRIFIYFRDSLNINTQTYNKFTSWAGYYNTSGKGVSPMFSTSTGFYVYDITSVYNDLWNWSYVNNPNITEAIPTTSLDKYKSNDPHMAVMSRYPDVVDYVVNINCFNNSRNLVTLALYNSRICSRFGNSTSNLFRDCYNLKVVQGLRTTTGMSPNLVNTVANNFMAIPIDDMSNTYVNCYNLGVACPVGSNVTNIAYMFANCRSFDFNVQLGDNSVNTSGTFYGCSNLNKSIRIPSASQDASNMFYGCTSLNRNMYIPANVKNMSGTFYACSNFSKSINITAFNVEDATNCFYGSSKFKEVYIPYYYSNGDRTKTFNSFVNAGYLDENGVSTGKNNTVFYDMVL